MKYSNRDDILHVVMAKRMREEEALAASTSGSQR